MLRIIVLVLCLLLAGCASTEPASSATGTPLFLGIQANKHLNPNDKAQPQPLELRLYQLSNRQHWQYAPLDALYPVAQPTLAQDIVAMHTVYLTPGEQLHQRLTLDPRTVELFVLAAFQYPQNSQWHAMLPIAPDTVLYLQLKAHDRQLAATLTRIPGPGWWKRQFNAAGKLLGLLPPTLQTPSGFTRINLDFSDSNKYQKLLK